MLAGRFSALAFPDLVSTIDMEKRSGSLSIATANSVGAVYFDEGRVVHALFANLVGPRAFYRLMAEPDAQFEFTQEPCPVAARERTIRESVASLIMESARVIDTERRDGTLPPDGSPPPPPSPSATAGASDAAPPVAPLAPPL